MTFKSQNSRDNAAILFVFLFFLLFFALIPCAIFYPSESAIIRSFFYLLTSSVSLALCILNRKFAAESAVILNREQNLCRFSSTKVGGFGYDIIRKPLDTLCHASLRERAIDKMVSATYGISVKRRVPEYRIYLHFSDESTIGWEDWLYPSIVKSHLLKLTDKINQFIEKPHQIKLRVDTYHHTTGFILISVITLIFFWLGISQ